MEASFEKKTMNKLKSSFINDGKKGNMSILNNLIIRQLARCAIIVHIFKVCSLLIFFLPTMVKNNNPINL